MPLSGFRLRKNSDIERVFRGGVPIFCTFLGCRYLKGRVFVLAAFSVSKKQFPLAVDRNRIKRRLREAFRAYQQKGEIPTGEYVFFLTKGVKEPSFQEIKDTMRAIFQKIR